jgi:hypothetical protein
MATKERLAGERSLAELDRARDEDRIIPYLVQSHCPEPGCRGFLTFSGRSDQDGMGPLINIHYCNVCQIRDDLAQEYYPRVIYRTVHRKFVAVPGAERE